MNDTVLTEQLNKYAEDYTKGENDLLQKIDRETHLEIYQSNMLSGKVQGRFLSMISRFIQPKTIVEIGTFTGYSAVCLAEGLAEDGKLHTIDINDEIADRCRKYFAEANISDKIQLHTGDALDILPSIPGPYDLVFIDADKPNYSHYFDLVIDKVRPGGYIIADNVLYHGEVLLQEEKRSKNGSAIAAFNRKIASDERIIPLLLPVRDGLFILEKI